MRPLLEQEAFHEEQGRIGLIATEEGECRTAADLSYAQQR